ncbi:MAG: hypothetical protein R2873_31880 [Caldilineaceae bacterium]
MLQTTFAQERQRWLEEGREEGREKGREEGREEGREQGIAQVAWTMHRRGFALSVIADITGLSEDELNMLLTSAPPDDVNS